MSSLSSAISKELRFISVFSHFARATAAIKSITRINKNKNATRRRRCEFTACTLHLSDARDRDDDGGGGYNKAATFKVRVDPEDAHYFFAACGRSVAVCVDRLKLYNRVQFFEDIKYKANQ